MFCKHCGKEIEENSNICWNCGEFLDNDYKSDKHNVENALTSVESKKNDKIELNSKSSVVWWGVLSCIFLGVIGLIIGLAIYSANSSMREKFIKAWLITFIIIFCLFLITCMSILIVNISKLTDLVIAIAIKLGVIRG